MTIHDERTKFELAYRKCSSAVFGGELLIICPEDEEIFKLLWSNCWTIADSYFAGRGITRITILSESKKLWGSVGYDLVQGGQQGRMAVWLRRVVLKAESIFCELLIKALDVVKRFVALLSGIKIDEV